MSRHCYELQFEVENACYLNCMHCSSLEMRQAEGRKYSDEELISFLSVFQENMHVYLTGGEPLLYTDILRLCNNISKIGNDIRIGLFTTGNCMGGLPISKDLALAMKQSGIVDCYFSIYSEIEREHDEWTMLPGSFQNTLKSVEILRNVGILPKAHLVLTSFNKNRIKSVVEFCYEIGLDEVRILKLTPSGKAIEYWNEIGIDLEEQNRIIGELVKKKVEYPIHLTFSGYPNLHPCRPLPNSMKCQAGTHLLYIDLEGNVYPCACAKRFREQFQICHITDTNEIRKYITEQESKEYNLNCINEVHS